MARVGHHHYSPVSRSGEARRCRSHGLTFTALPEALKLARLITLTRSALRERQVMTVATMSREDLAAFKTALELRAIHTPQQAESIRTGLHWPAVTPARVPRRNH